MMMDHLMPFQFYPDYIGNLPAGRQDLESENFFLCGVKITKNKSLKANHNQYNPVINYFYNCHKK